MPGTPLTESAVSRSDRSVGIVGLRMLAANVAVGVLAGLAVAHIRLGLGLPGHKVFLWMTPIIISRLLARHPLGATAGALSAGCVSVGLGGNFAGGLLFLPLVGVAGMLVDVCITFADRKRLAAWLLIALVGMSGMAASVLCAGKRLLVPVVHTHVVLGLSGPLGRILSYAMFGLAAGLVGGSVALGIRKVRESKVKSRK